MSGTLSDGRANLCAGIVFALLSLSVALLPTASGATTYYVDANDPNARDTNAGTESRPFKTIGKSTSLVTAGDTVFIKAGIYREMVVLSKSGSDNAVGRYGPTTLPITFAACPGHEGKVIIDAAEPLLEWHKCTGPGDCAGNPNWEHVYWADVAALVQVHPDAGFAVRQVFQHGKLLKRSRYPDTGWSYPTSMPDPKSRFSDASLSKPDGYFTGSVCHIKTRVWQIEPIPITSFAESTFTLSRSPRYAITTQYGYYLTSIVGEINEEGEWAYDPAQKRVYLWPEGDVAEGVEFSYRQYCLRSYNNTSWNVVRGLTMRNACQHGIYLYRSNDMTVEGNTIEHAYDYGIQVHAGSGGKGDNNQIVRNMIRYSASRGINVDRYCSNTNVEGNSIYATATESFADDILNGRGEAIYVTGPYTRVFNNRIDRVGHTGIYISGNTLSRDISYNYITNAMLGVSDGGGIYTGGYSDTTEKDHIHHNIIIDVIGCLSMDRSFDNGNPPTMDTHAGGIAPGIYIDEEGNNRIIEDNTVINCRMAGIYFHWGPSNVVQRNTLYGNHLAQVRFDGTGEARKTLVDDSLLGNILFATSAEQKTLFLYITYDNVQFGESDRNYFYNPYDNMNVSVIRYPQSGGVIREDLTLDGWRALSGYDGDSQEFSHLTGLDGMTVTSPTKSEIVYNASLDAVTVDLEPGTYCDVQGNEVQGSVTLGPFGSKVLITADFAVPGSPVP